MCTVIPTDHLKPEETPIRYPVFNNLLSCVEICSKIPEVEGQSVVKIDPAANPAGTTHYTYIYDAMKNAPDCCHFYIENTQWYVCALQAMMLWCLREEERSVWIYIVDGTFNRPAGWSYRYFWRHQARVNKAGLSINHVGVLADEAAKICQQIF